MSHRKPNPHALISIAEAHRAIYIDCEGFENRSPTLLGILVGEALEQVVLDPDLAVVAEARNHRLSTFKREAAQLLERSVNESRLIVAYSQHERNLFMTYAQVDIVDAYRDARMIAKRWRNALHPENSSDGRGLKDFLEFIKFPRGIHLGHRKSTKRIKAVLDMIKIRKTYEALTPVKKAQWTKLLEHNAIDCRGMRELVMRAAGEMAARSAGSLGIKGARLI
jgi:hypothetical protein